MSEKIFEVKVGKKTVRIKVSRTGAVKISGAGPVKISYELGDVLGGGSPIPISVCVHPYANAYGDDYKIETWFGGRGFKKSIYTPCLETVLTQDEKRIRISATDPTKKIIHDLGTKPVKPLTHVVQTLQF